MSKKPSESFFDDNSPNYKIWQSPNGIYKLDIKDIVFQGYLLKYCQANKQLKERYFILTEKYLFYLAAPNTPTFIAIMPTQWIRVDYLILKLDQTPSYCFKFIRNKRMTDLFTTEEDVYEEWKVQFSKVFWQCNFQAKYEPLKEIGKGSFAKVYLVKNINTGKEYAAKAFSKKPSSSLDDRRQSLINEIEALRQLKHDNIIKLEELHESKNSIYLILELLEGGELLDVLTSSESLNSKSQKEILKSLLDALAYMEEKMIMHRDIKPTNIILKTKDTNDISQIKLIDFGLATFRFNPNPIFKRCGTPGFIAPEVLNCSSTECFPYSTTCDVFSVGIIFYIMLAGKSPFDGSNIKKILESNQKCNIDMFNPKLHKNKLAYDLLLRLLEKDPDDRITASKALKHAYFDHMTDNEKTQNENLCDTNKENNNIKIYLENYKNSAYLNTKKNELGSPDIQQNIILGTTSTYDIESMNIQEAIFSLKTIGPVKNKENKEEKQTILKTALMNNSVQFLDEIYQIGFVEEEFNSDSEN